MKHTLLSRLLGARGLLHFPRRRHQGTHGRLAVPAARAAAPLAQACIAAVEALEGRSYFSFVVDGTVFFDWNEDGFKDPGEPVQRNRQVAYAYTPVDGNGDPLPRVGLTKRTDENGYFSFTIPDHLGSPDQDWIDFFDPDWHDIVTTPGTEPGGGSNETFHFGIFSLEGPPEPYQSNDSISDCGCEDVSAEEVQYATGQITQTITSLISLGFSMAFGSSRGWTNSYRYEQENLAGNGWVSSNLPSLNQQADGDRDVAVILGPGRAQWFDQSGGTYAPRHNRTDTLTYGTADDSSGTNEFTLTNAADGSQVRFYSFESSVPRYKQGTFKSFRDPSGNRISAYSHDGDGRLTELRRSITAGGVTTVESWLYSYYSSGDNAGKLQTLTLRRSTNGGSSWSTVGSESSDYYTNDSSGEWSYGSLGDLRSLTTRDKDGNATGTWYFRYGGGGMQYMLDPAAFARLASAVSNPYTADDSTVELYATKAYTYADFRVASVTSAGAGSNQGSGDGRGTTTYTYTTSEHSDGHNSWKTKTVETLPNGDTNTVFTNYLGKVMLRVFQDNSSGQTFSGKRLATFHKYDSAGRVVMTAHPSAFDPDEMTGALYDEEEPDLLVDQGGGDYLYLGDDFGQLDLFTYAGSTSGGIDHDTAGNVAGMLSATYQKRGDVDAMGSADDPILMSAVQYFEKTYSPSGGVSATIHPLALTTVYPNAVPGTAGTGLTTNYGYSFFSNTLLAESITVEQPVVSTGSNGPGGSTRDTDVTFFDALGNPTWTKDAGGFITYASWDAVTGAPLKFINDVVYASLSGAEQTSFGATGWSNPSGGLHLTTTMEVDHLGRTTKLTDPNGNVTYTVYKDAEHEVRTYRGFVATSSSTGTVTGPIEVVREYRPEADADEGERTLYFETLTLSVAPAVAGSVPTGNETFDEGDVLSLTRTLTNDAGQVTQVDAYYSMAGMTYERETPSLGSASNDSSSGNRHSTTYDYDDGGRLAVVEDPTGTITRTVFDGRGNPAAVYVGTDDTDATDLDPTGNAAEGNNMVKVSETEYDQSCGCPSSSGDGQPTKITLYPGGGAEPRVTEMYYDWRGRLVATKSGVQVAEGTGVQRPISYVDLNNLGQVTASYVYDGDNVSVSETDGTPNKPSSSLLRAKTTTSYDEQLRPFKSQRFSVDPSSGTVSSDSLTTNVFYDRRGNVIKTAAPGGLVQKNTFNGVGWITASFTSDGGGDSGWSDADDVSGDKVLEQAEYVYDANGNVVATASKQRFHDETGTGALGDATTSPLARISYTAAWYDALDRTTDWVDVGTFGGAVPTRPSSAPSRSDTILVTSYAYDAAGNLQDVTDPRGNVTRTAYDLLGRTTSTTEAYVNGTPSDADDRITRYTYNGLGSVLTLTADMPSGTNDQTTQYVYGEPTQVVTSLTSSGAIATATVTGHGYKAGETVVIGGAAEPDYNGTFVITAVTANTFSYDTGASPSSPDSGTLITVRRTTDAFSNRFLSAVRYPDKSAGTAGTAITDKETFTVNALGETKTMADKNGNVHTYGYDVLGRFLADDVTTLGSGVDGAVRLLQTSYDTQFLPEKFTSWSGVQTPADLTNSSTTATATITGHGFVNGDTVQVSGAEEPEYNGVFVITVVDPDTFTYTMSADPGFSASGSIAVRRVVNEVQRAYNGLGQITTEYQEHSGAVSTGSSPKVQYAYTEMASSANHSRLKSTTYPNGRALRYEYSSGLDSNISRLSFMADDSSGSVGTHLEEYSYLGLSTIVRAARPEPGTELTYIKQTGENNGDAGDKYIGLDRFGRVADQRWLATSGPTDVDRFQYGYDKNSNPLYKNNTLSSANSELYHANSSTSGDNNTAYDKLNRLTGFRRGTLSSSGNNGAGLDTVSSASRTQSWDLDALGNMDTVTTDGTPESRTHNSGNQLTDVGANALSFDDAGNTTANDRGWTFQFDAWNRMTTTLSPNGDGTTGPTQESWYYGYDAMGRRITADQVVDFNDGDPAVYNQYGGTTDLYYSVAWQVIEECSTSYHNHYELVEEEWVWAPSTAAWSTQYVWGARYIDDLILRDRDADADDETGDLGKADSGLEERLYVQYDANHNVTSLTNASGTVQQRFVYDPYGQSTILAANWSGASDGYAWLYRHQGGRLETATGTYIFRHRDYDPVLGRWLEEDPAGFGEGLNIYLGLTDSPASNTDPLGLWTTDGTPWTMDKAIAVAQAGDTLASLAKAITGSDIIPKGEDRVMKVGEKVDATPFLRALEKKYRESVLNNTSAFRSKFGKPSPVRCSAKKLRELYFNMDKDKLKHPDCLATVEIVIRKAIADIYGDGRFDRRFDVEQGNQDPPMTKLDPSANSEVGDHVRFQNGSGYNEGDGWDFESTIKIGDDKYWGNGLGSINDVVGPGVMSEAGVIDVLTRRYDRWAAKNGRPNASALPPSKRPHISSIHRLDIAKLGEMMLGTP